ncbi:MAG TPA: peptidase S10 [Acidobacteriaceae bacterium]|jgi:carboxypeptidase C (cathepsin A)|nr:peptidase S10 [Acidobacteriaceae bacterium]
MQKTTRLLAAFVAAAVTLTPVIARAAGQDKTKDKTAEPSAEKATAKAPAQEVTTQGTVDAEGQHVTYNAVAGTITVGATDVQDAQLGPDGKPQADTDLAAAVEAAKNVADAPPLARIFYVAYFRQDANGAQRPITFLYNGGPGSSTVWLHMGSFGPKHVVTETDVHPPAAPYKLADNPYSLLDVSDLVFIDMPGTGFGRLTGKDSDKAFWGVDQDGHAYARFIQRFLSKYNRWNSPKYLFGESYGTTRSAVLSNLLENEYNIDLNGVVLLSQIFNFTSDIDAAQMNPGVDMTYELALPTYAATARYHHKLPQEHPDLEAFMKEVETFAMGPYAEALAKGTDLSATEKQSVAEKLHEYTGLPVDYLVKADLRVSGGQFEHNLQGDSGMTTGRLDTRFSGPSIDPLGESAEYDPQSSAISSAYVSLFNEYVRQTLKYGAGETYLPEAQFHGFEWDLKHNGNPINLNVAPDLAMAMKTNDKLKVLVNGGYYDLATPFYAAFYEDKHLPIPEKLASNIEYQWYESGHMVYVKDATLKELHDRVATFIKSTEAGNE